jgi:hypothetical protein
MRPLNAAVEKLVKGGETDLKMGINEKKTIKRKRNTENKRKINVANSLRSSGLKNQTHQICRSSVENVALSFV